MKTQYLYIYLKKKTTILTITDLNRSKCACLFKKESN